jgi:3-oxoacyl-[acyl-carrier-protein] synthase III
VRISAVAHATPTNIVTNEELVRRILEHPENQIPAVQRRVFEMALRQLFLRTGAVTRHHRAPGERAIDIGRAAGQAALERAGMQPRDIDLLIYVGVGRGWVEPATANAFQELLGLERATCFDVLDACASWLRAVDIVRHLLKAGTYARAMVVNCECNFEEYIRWDFHSIRDLEQLFAGFTVGEAATATILEATPSDRWRCSFRTAGEHHRLCQIPLPHACTFGGPPSGRGTLKFSARANELHVEAIHQLESHWASEPAISEAPFDLAFGHSTSVPAMRQVIGRLGIDESRVYETFTRYGNTVSASLPLGLSLAAAEGRLTRGDDVLLVMASAGITTGFARFGF